MIHCSVNRSYATTIMGARLMSICGWAGADKSNLGFSPTSGDKQLLTLVLVMASDTGRAGAAHHSS